MFRLAWRMHYVRHVPPVSVYFWLARDSSDVSGQTDQKTLVASPRRVVM